MGDMFFKQAVRNGQMSVEEFTNLKGTGTLPAPPTEFKTYDSFVALVMQDTGWPEVDVRRLLLIKLEQLRISPQDVECYINYPDWTMAQLALRLGITRDNTDRAIKRVRRSCPGLRFDVSVNHGREVPSMSHMRRIECTSNTDWLDDDNESMIKF